MKKSNIILIVIVLLAANLIVSSLLLSRPIAQNQCPEKSRSLLCEAMPIKFALDNPDCANKLLMAMNVTNVKVLPQNSTNMLVQ